MSTLATNALVTVAEFYDMLGIDADNIGYNDNQIITLINMVTKRIENYCQRIFVPSTSVSEIFGGDDTKDYWVRNKHITAITAIYKWGGTSWNELTITSYPYTYSTGGRVYFTNGDIFSRGYDNYKLTYTYGYARGSLPVDLKMACCIWVHRALLKISGKEGIQSESFGDVTTTFNLDKMPEDLSSLLAPYRRLM